AVESRGWRSVTLWRVTRRRTGSPPLADCSSTPTSLSSSIEDGGMLLRQLDRRSFLWHSGGGLGGIALAYLLGHEGVLAADRDPGKGRPELNGGLHHRARARRVVQLFMSGAASQVDTFDYKPELIKRHGQK